MLDPNKNENWKTEFNNFQKQIAELQSAEALKPQAALPEQKTGILSKVGAFFKPELTWDDKLNLAMKTISNSRKFPSALATAWKEEEAVLKNKDYKITNASKLLLEVYRNVWTKKGRCCLI